MTETRLDPADHAWMTAPSTRRVMGALNPEDGDQARFVGGCVRNAFLGVPVDDVDIATTLTPDQAVARLEAAGIKVAPTGIEHGTVTAIVDGAPFEVTSLRKDVETFGRRAVVAFTTDWREDALRRDFRLNAIYARPDGTVFDPFGGIADAHARRIIFIGQARDRIAEDHLRILRFYRFTAWYGREIDAEGHRACVEMAETLKALSVERVWKELKKLLAAPDPSDTVKAMQEGHVLKQVLTGHIDFNLFFDIINADRGKARSPDPFLRLVALSGGDEAAMLALCKQMKASNAEAARAKALTQPLDGLILRADADHETLSRAVYAIGSDAVQGRLRLAEAAHDGDAQAALDFVDGYEPPRFPLKGRDLIQAGFERGPELGALLKQLERVWIDSVFTLDREALLAKARGGRA
jgi:poly(A) polymerase